ncbi:hypothetical protein MNV49_004316 [Pseudohyphozyma bogoriensis]|nr:hypothetical protein MNV49_004316 [Pseudohyphozyma bogoriensis]
MRVLFLADPDNSYVAVDLLDTISSKRTYVSRAASTTRGHGPRPSHAHSSSYSSTTKERKEASRKETAGILESLGISGSSEFSLIDETPKPASRTLAPSASAAAAAGSASSGASAGPSAGGSDAEVVRLRTILGDKENEIAGLRRQLAQASKESEANSRRAERLEKEKAVSGGFGTDSKRFEDISRSFAEQEQLLAGYQKELEKGQVEQEALKKRYGRLAQFVEKLYGPAWENELANHLDRNGIANLPLPGPHSISSPGLRGRPSLMTTPLVGRLSSGSAGVSGEEENELVDSPIAASPSPGVGGSVGASGAGGAELKAHLESLQLMLRSMEKRMEQELTYEEEYFALRARQQTELRSLWDRHRRELDGLKHAGLERQGGQDPAGTATTTPHGAQLVHLESTSSGRITGPPKPRLTPQEARKRFANENRKAAHRARTKAVAALAREAGYMKERDDVQRSKSGSDGSGSEDEDGRKKKGKEKEKTEGTDAESGREDKMQGVESASVNGEAKIKAENPPDSVRLEAQKGTYSLEMQVEFDMLREEVAKESFAVKNKFPRRVRPLIVALALRALDLDEYDDDFFAMLPKILPYNLFTMKKFTKREVFPHRIARMTAEQDKHVEALRKGIEEQLPKQKREFDAHFGEWEAGKEDREKKMAVDGSPVPTSDAAVPPKDTPSIAGEDVSMSMGSPGPIECAEIEGPRIIRCTVEMFAALRSILEVQSQMELLIEELKFLDEGAPAPDSIFADVTVLYTKVAALWPGGLMTGERLREGILGRDESDGGFTTAGYTDSWVLPVTELFFERINLWKAQAIKESCEGMVRF